MRNLIKLKNKIDIRGSNMIRPRCQMSNKLLIVHILEPHSISQILQVKFIKIIRKSNINQEVLMESNRIIANKW